jgi:hypothetical protein
MGEEQCAENNKNAIRPIMRIIFTYWKNSIPVREIVIFKENKKALALVVFDVRIHHGSQLGRG